MKTSAKLIFNHHRNKGPKTRSKDKKKNELKTVYKEPIFVHYAHVFVFAFVVVFVVVLFFSVCGLQMDIGTSLPAYRINGNFLLATTHVASPRVIVHDSPLDLRRCVKLHTGSSLFVSPFYNHLYHFHDANLLALATVLLTTPGCKQLPCTDVISSRQLYHLTPPQTPDARTKGFVNLLHKMFNRVDNATKLLHSGQYVSNSPHKLTTDYANFHLFCCLVYVDRSSLL
jgi:hypothetical protein